MSWPPSRWAKASFRTVRGMDDYSGRPGSSGSALASISLILSSSVLCLALDRHDAEQNRCHDREGVDPR